MKKQYKTLITLSLCAGMAGSLITPAYAYEKDETVYITLHENGSLKEVIVGDQLKADGEKQIRDISNLKNIQNVNGDENFKQNGETLVWDNQGHDIYYEGTSSKELPIKMNISYSLNGESITPQKLKGKKGTVEIKIHLENLDKHEDLYTPFVVTLASVLPTDGNSEIQVTNGKVVSNGKSNAIVAVAAPGLYESLDKNALLKDFDTITIRYNTEKFESLPIYAMATPKLLEESDLDFDSRFNDISSQLQTLQNASSQLVNGSGELASGSNQLSFSYRQFDSGIAKLLEGTGTLAKQYQTLDQGIQTLAKQSESFQSITTLLDKLSSLSSATQALDQGIATLKQSVEVSSDPNSEINKKLNALQTDLTTQQQELLALQSSMKQLQVQLQTRVQSFIGISQQLETAIAKETQEEQKATLQNIKAQLDTQIQELTNNLQQLAQGMNILEAKLAVIAQDMNELNVLSKQMNESVISGLNSAINEFSKGNEQLKQGLAMIQKQTANLPNLLKQFVAGSKQLSDGSTKVNNALVFMNQSTNTLYQANTQIKQAIGKLADGAVALQKGMLQFDKDGIQNISSLSTILKNAGDKADRLIQLSDEYKTFTKVNNDIQSDVKFIYTVQSDEAKK